MPFAPVNGIELYYETHGKGPALVFAHGSGGNHMSWWQQVPFFSEHYTCVSFDHRSFGMSHDNPVSEGGRAFADDLRQLLDYIGIDRTAIIAHSMGGRTAVGFTIRNPKRVWGMVLCGSNGGAVNEESRQVWSVQQEENRHLPTGTIRGLSPTFIKQHPKETFLFRQILRLNPRNSPDFLAVSSNYRGSTYSRLIESEVPIMYMVGQNDIIAPPRTIEIAASLVSQARLLVVPDSGHSVYYEKPDVFNREVESFLREVYTERT